uniref:Ig-like domain-containing protein n=1 Tax=Monopterus albus TaxID=43700 RepID=A0A3Q3JV87_MONAL
KGPTEPVLEGQPIQLECLYSDSELNISQVHFEVFSKVSRRNKWLGGCERKQWFYERWCFSWRMSPFIEQTTNSLVLYIHYAGRFSEGPYRCVSDSENVTAPDNVSQPLTFKVFYLGEVSVSRAGYTRYLDLSQELRVHPGDDVVLKCSASSSEEPNYFWQKELTKHFLPCLFHFIMLFHSPGQYTCTAEHPSVDSFSKKRTISITVLSENAAWYESTNGHLILMTLAAVVALLVFILSMTVFLCRRAKQAKTHKGPIDDRSQKKPIYKTSVESVPSTCGDNQPLV